MTNIEENIKNLAVIAHDLKAPLSAVVDLLHVLEKGYVDDPEKVKELITRARKKSVVPLYWHHREAISPCNHAGPMQIPGQR